MTTKKTSSKKPASKKPAAKTKPYVQPSSQLGTGVLPPVTPPLSSEQARKQLRGF
jgi:hypothetical protein